MTFILVSNGVIEKYPYTFGMLRKDNPNTSFPMQGLYEAVQGLGVYPVVEVDKPHADFAVSNIVEGQPEFVDGVWRQTWNVVPASPEEIAKRTEGKSSDVRSQRDNLLAETDWVVIKAQETGVAVDAAWATYRQALRDITTHANWPHLEEGDWPVKP